MSKSQSLLAVVIAVLLCGGSFYAGMKYAGSVNPPRQMGAGGFGQGGAGFQRGTGPGAGTGGNMIRGGMRGQAVTNGDISKIEGSMITVKLPDGGSKLIITSSSTKVMQMTEATPDILKTETPVMVMGSANADGSLTASTIQIRPARPPMPPTETKDSEKK